MGSKREMEGMGSHPFIGPGNFWEDPRHNRIGKNWTSRCPEGPWFWDENSNHNRAKLPQEMEKGLKSSGFPFYIF